MGGRKVHGRGRALANHRVTERLLKVADMYRRGKSQQDIAKELDVHPSTITRDVDRLHREWQEIYIRDIQAMKGRMLAELTLMKAEAWEEWERSKGKRHRVASKKSSSSDGDKSEITTTVQEYLGDPRYLQVIGDCIQQEADILGIKVIKLAPTDPTGASSLAPHIMAELMQIAEGVNSPVVYTDDVIEGEITAILPALEDSVQVKDDSAGQPDPTPGPTPSPAREEEAQAGNA